MHTVTIKSRNAFQEFVTWCLANPGLVRLFYVTWSAEWARSELAAVVIRDAADAAYCALRFGVTMEDYDPVARAFWYERSDQDDN